MRTAFIEELIRQARANPRIFLVVGDLGFSVVEPFANEFPNRFLNAGVAEQNMTGVAAGLASEGWHVVTYSIANFPTLRCIEQIRNDIVYHHLPVAVVAVGGGLAYGNLGYSHHGIQDIAILRSLSKLTILSPSDPDEAGACVQWISQNPGPCYLRLGKAKENRLHQPQPLQRAPLSVLSHRSEVAIAATGSILGPCLDAAKQLAAEGRSVAVYSLPWLHPLDTADLAVLQQHRTILAVEEHLESGGLASILRERLSPEVRILSAAIGPKLMHTVGSQDWLRRQAGIDADSLAGRCRTLIHG